MDYTEVFQKIDSGEIKLYNLESQFGIKESIEIRKKYVEYKTSLSFDSLNNLDFDSEKIVNRNCENVIGQVALPLGVAGPIQVRGIEEGSFMLPIGTTEGALTASINRGCKVITASNGARTISTYHGITRAPVFKTSGLDSSQSLVNFAEENFSKLQEIASSTNAFIKLTKMDPLINGRSVWLRFAFDTSDAMGMNMAVKATNEITNYIEKEFDTELIATSGNACTDKKVAGINDSLGRGRTVQAEVKISRENCEKYLKTTPEKIVEVSERKIWQGSQIANSRGFNAHTANIVSSIFVATGQDIAHTVDASSASTVFEMDGDDLYVNVRIPSLNIATVGGGSHLPTQSAMVEMMLTDIDSQKQVEKRTDMFAQIIGAAVLAGEISLNGAFASRTFVKAHEDLGRGNSQ